MKSDELVDIAYKKLKQTVYHEQLNLFQRKKLADFECANNFEEKLKIFVSVIDSIKNNSSRYHPILDQHIKKIGFKLLPKTVKTQEDQKKDEIKKSDKQKYKDKCFLTNKKSSDKYFLEGANYFIDAPIELHLISVIWLMKVGIYLEPEICDSCYGSRLNEKLFRSDDKSSHLFRMYPAQYQKWRNGALEKADAILKTEEKDVAILSLDFKHCFYCINTDFNEICNILKTKIQDIDDRNFAIKLTEILKEIHLQYKKVISNFSRSSHSHIPESIIPLPVGFVSSSLLCNWHLKELDEKIMRTLSPDYYGRYVDDILIVMSNPVIEPENRIHNFMKRYFCDTKIFDYDSKKESYSLMNNKILQIQEKKLILQFFSAEHSLALLDSFKQKVDENASAFFFLPEDDLNYFINNNSYNILYDGSTNKWRNIIGIVENVTELSKNLTKIITGLTQSKINNDELSAISDQLFKFYKGKNFVTFCRTWEKLFSFIIMTNQQKNGAIFYFDIHDTILKITKFSSEDENKEIECRVENSPQINNEILQRLKNNLLEYLLIAISIPVGLLGNNHDIYLKKHVEESNKRYQNPLNSNQEAKEIKRYSKLFRQSNLIRHNYVAYPLINYTDYHLSLIDWDKFEKSFAKQSFTFNQKKIDRSPRFIHFDEFYLFKFLQHVLHGDKIEYTLLEEKFNEISHVYEHFPISIRKNNELSISDRHDIIEIIEYCIPKKYSTPTEKLGKIKVGVANIKITDEDVEKSYFKNQKPNLSFERQKGIFSLLNQAKKRECDLLILPELSIPYRWLPFMVKYARNHQIALIFGMEYWIVKRKNYIAYNYIVSALPVKNKEQYKTCCVSIRCKNHYAPQEIKNLNDQKRYVPDKSYFRYDLFKWRGCQFSIYNCYEVSDIRHRGIFKSELDFLVACVLNRDINYFSSIVESVVKDLHCYVIQVNCSEYGDSRIVQPTKKENMDILRVSGGKDNTILTAELDIDKLRKFQLLDDATQLSLKDDDSVKDDEKFKPNPPGFNRTKIKNRGNCLKMK